jgi:hypothetical protein
MSMIPDTVNALKSLFTQASEVVSSLFRAFLPRSYISQDAETKSKIVRRDQMTEVDLFTLISYRL